MEKGRLKISRDLENYVKLTTQNYFEAIFCELQSRFEK